MCSYELMIGGVDDLNYDDSFTARRRTVIVKRKHLKMLFYAITPGLHDCPLIDSKRVSDR